MVIPPIITIVWLHLQRITARPSTRVSTSKLTLKDAFHELSPLNLSKIQWSAPGKGAKAKLFVQQVPCGEHWH